MDRCVVQAAADPGRIARGDPVDARALACSRALDAIVQARLHVVVTHASLVEWQRSARWAKFVRWRARLEERGLLEDAGALDTASIDEAIAALLPPDRRRAAHKDAHLVAAAVDHADARLLSTDRRARGHFVALWVAGQACDGARCLARLGALHWVDPTEDEAVAVWLGDWMPDRPPWTIAGRAAPAAGTAQR